MAVYVVADIEVLDEALYEQYRQEVPATITAHGGRYVARGGTTQVLEGQCCELKRPPLCKRGEDEA